MQPVGTIRSTGRCPVKRLVCSVRVAAHRLPAGLLMGVDEIGYLPVGSGGVPGVNYLDRSH